jgi:hypothetical protein
MHPNSSDTLQLPPRVSRLRDRDLFQEKMTHVSVPHELEAALLAQVYWLHNSFYDSERKSRVDTHQFRLQCASLDQSAILNTFHLTGEVLSPFCIHDELFRHGGARRRMVPWSSWIENDLQIQDRLEYWGD